MILRRLACLGAIAVFAWSQDARDEAQFQIQKLLTEGNAQEAEAAARRGLGGLKQLSPGGNLETARLLDLLATALAAQAVGTAAVKEVVDRAIAIKVGILGPDHSSIAASLVILGKQQAGSGDYAGAVATLERALSLQEKDSAAPRSERVQVQDALGSALTDAGQYAPARQMLERALGLSEAESGPDSRSVGEILRHLGVNGWQSGDMPRAKVYLERAIAIFERTLGPDHLSTGNAVGDLASVIKLTGNYAAAKPLFQRSLRIYELRLGPDHPRLAVPLNNLALCVKELDEFDEARDLLRRALEILEKRLGPDNSRTATVLQNLGIVYREMGDFTHSRQAYERALGIQERRLGPDHPLVAAVFNSLGDLLKDLGDGAEAKPYLARALAIYQKNTAADNPKIPEVMQSLAGVLRQTGDRAGARQMLERAVSIYTGALGAENPKLVDPLLSLGEVLFEAGDVAGAQALYDRARGIQEKAAGRDNLRTATALDHLAALAAARKDFKQEAQLEQESIRIWSKTLGRQNPYLAEPLARLAQALGHLGQGEEALRAALDSAQIRREHLRLTVRALPERQALLFAAGGNGGLDAALSLVAAEHSALPADVRAAWDELVHDRALVLDEMAARHRAAHTSDGAAVPAERLRVAREHFARLVVSGPDSKATETDAARWQLAREAVDLAEETLAAAVTDYRRKLDSQRSGYAEMSAALPLHSALVAFARYRQEPFADPHARAEPFYLAFVLRAGDREPAMVRLGPAASIEARVSTWRVEIHREAGSMGRNARWNEQEYRKAGVALRKAVWDPLEPHLRGTASVFVVPDGALQLVNLNTLPWGETAYLVEHGPLLHTLSAERDLIEAPRAHPGRGLLALGNPSYQAAPPSRQAVRRGGAHSRCADFASLRFQPLPASAAEVRAIVAIWSAQGETAMLLSGADASEADFKRNAAGKRVLHLATHGFFLSGECRADSGLTENPLLRAGLALAGANQRQSAATDEDDGILTAEEVASLNLEGTEWVVLSGCDTGQGETRAGEGVLGLRRAFRIAGADTLIASLWAVEDEATRQWMTALYESHFGQSRSTAESLASATLRQLRARRAKGLSTHPFYWGSFLAVGNWR